MKTVICVTNDVVTDQRLYRMVTSLRAINPGILVIGRKRPATKLADDYPCKVLLMHLPFSKGFLFYASYNIALFIRLMRVNASVLIAIDLDTLPAVYLASLVKRVTLIYDCHEYFTEVPELVNRKFVRKVWLLIESLLLPRIKYSFTVSPSIAREYKIKYGLNMVVVRNLPIRFKNNNLSYSDLRMIKGKNIIYQGSLNVGRGLEVAVSAMEYLPSVHLIIAGTGDIEAELKALSVRKGLSERVHFIGRVSPRELIALTKQADLGISLEEASCLSYYYSLPNKLFDYIQAEIPVLVSDLPEMADVVKTYNVGDVCNVSNAAELATIIKNMLYDEARKTAWKENLKYAARELCWEKEEHKLIGLFNDSCNQ